MALARKRGEIIRQFILDNVEAHPTDVVRVAAKKFGVTRQAINKHIKVLVNQESISVWGTTKNRAYRLRADIYKEFHFAIDDRIQEDMVWREDILPLLEGLHENAITAWNYCFTEMFNNAIDHSNGSEITVILEKTAVATEIGILDDGEGIFKKIQREFGLLDERHAVLELSKGKVTTDPENHTGEGIFFSSRMMAWFAILSGSTFFSHNKEDDIDWILELQRRQGTHVYMKMRNDAAITVQSVFDQYTNPANEDYGFNKTHIQVGLVRYGDEMLVSRSQAKRLLARIDRFKVVILDFEGVPTIGQAFADEIFRVFAQKNSTLRVIPVNMTESVQKMVLRAL